MTQLKHSAQYNLLQSNFPKTNSDWVRSAHFTHTNIFWRHEVTLSFYSRTLGHHILKRVHLVPDYSLPAPFTHNGRARSFCLEAQLIKGMAILLWLPDVYTKRLSSSYVSGLSAYSLLGLLRLLHYLPQESCGYGQVLTTACGLYKVTLTVLIWNARGHCVSTVCNRVCRHPTPH